MRSDTAVQIEPEPHAWCKLPCVNFLEFAPANRKALKVIESPRLQELAGRAPTVSDFSRTPSFPGLGGNCKGINSLERSRQQA